MVYMEHLIFMFELGIFRNIKIWENWEKSLPRSLSFSELHRKAAHVGSSYWETFSKEPKTV